MKIYLFYLLNILIFHEIYMSTCHIEVSKNKLSIVIKLFRNDLEDDLRFTENKSISIDNKAKLESNKRILETYVKKRFYVKISDKNQDFIFKNFSLNNEVVKIEMESLFIDDRVKKLTIYNDFLTEVYDNQRNIVVVNTPNKKLFYAFNSKEKYKEFTF